MDMMLLSRRNPRGRVATVCRNGVAVVVDLLERRTGKRKQRRKRRRQRAGRLRLKYMHSKILRKELKVGDEFLVFTVACQISKASFQMCQVIAA